MIQVSRSFEMQILARVGDLTGYFTRRVASLDAMLTRAFRPC